MHRESAEHSIGLSDQATAPREMLPVGIPEGTVLYNPTSNSFGVRELLHGRIRTFGRPLAADYTEGTLVAFGSGFNQIEIHITRRGLTAEEINKAGNIARAVAEDPQWLPQKDLITEADRSGITLISNPPGKHFLPVRLLAAQEETAKPRESLLASLSKHPLAQKIREYRGRLQDTIFGGNAFGGHALYGSLGLVSLIPDLILGIRSEPTILSFGPMLSLIPAVLLPFTGYDGRRERVQAHLITFFPSLSIGCMFAGLVSSQLLGMDDIVKIREQIISIPIFGESTFSISNLAGLAAAVRVFLAYIETGYMSRDNRYEKWVFLDPPFFTRQLVGKLQGMREHMLADQFIKAFLVRDAENLLREDEIAWDWYRRIPKQDQDRLNPGILQKLILEANTPELRKPVKRELEEWFDPITSSKARASASYTRRPRRGTSGLRK